MFPRDNVGTLHVGPCSHKEGKRSRRSLAQLQSVARFRMNLKKDDEHAVG